MTPPLGGRGIGTNNDEETHLSNTTGGDKVFSTPWTTDRMLKMFRRETPGRD